MKQMILPGIERFFRSIPDTKEKQAYQRLLDAYLDVSSLMRAYPKLLPRSGLLNLKVMALIDAVDTLLQLQFNKE